jgi:hypothetical protein
MIRAILQKEWNEQRLRLLFAALVSALAVWFVLRANFLGLTESLLVALCPIGLIAAPGLAIATLGLDRAQGTWVFVASLPVRPADVYRVKWSSGAFQLLALFLVAGGAAFLAAASRGMLDAVAIPERARRHMGGLHPEGNQTLWLALVVLSVAVSFLAWYTTLFFLLTRAQSETQAYAGAALLSAVMIIWMIHGLGLLMDAQEFSTIVSVSVLVHPLSPMLTLTDPVPQRAGAFGTAIVVWTILPVWFAGVLTSRTEVR